LAKRRRAKLETAYPTPVSPARAAPTMFVVTHVRQALQQVAAIGAFSPYFAVAWATRAVQIVFTWESVSPRAAKRRSRA